jgi:hypothetical protein
MKNKPNITHISYTTLAVEIYKAGPSEIQGHDLVSEILKSKPTSFVSVSINPPASIHFSVLDAVQADSPTSCPIHIRILGTKRI